MSFSEGALNEPVNPDYYYPTNDIHYEVETKMGEEGWMEWKPVVVHFGETFTEDLEQAMRVRDTIVEQQMKARIIRVETLRSQVS